MEIFKKFAIIAHRGCSAHHADNSEAAFRAAVETGADCIETDVRMNAQGVLVCAHDADLVAQAISLEDAFGVTEQKIPFLLDIKEQGTDFLRSVCEVITGSGMQDKIVMGLRSVEQVVAFRAMNSDIPVLGFLQPDDFAAFYNAGGNIARLWESDLSERNVELVRRGKNTPVWVMAGTPQDGIGDITEERLKNIMKFSVNGVLVNDPAYIRSLLIHQR